MFRKKSVTGRRSSSGGRGGLFTFFGNGRPGDKALGN